MLEDKSEKRPAGHSEVHSEAASGPANEIIHSETVAGKLNGHDREKDKRANDENEEGWKMVGRRTKSGQGSNPTIKPTDDNSDGRESGGGNDRVTKEGRAQWTKQERNRSKGEKRGKRR